MKTYNERLNEIAEEMAKYDRPYSWKNLDEYLKFSVINKHKPLARIALKHMAEEWKNGYKQEYLGYTVEKHLIDNGLIEPQTT
jgi:hypothetical protein